MKRYLILAVLLASCSTHTLLDSDRSIIVMQPMDSVYNSVIQYCMENANGISFSEKQSGIVVSNKRLMTEYSILGNLNERLSFNLKPLSDSATSVYVTITAIGQAGETTIQIKKHYDKVLAKLRKNNL